MTVSEFRAWKKMAAELPPDHWRELLMRLPNRVRNHAASIIWFDLFGGRTVANRWPHLDSMVEQYKRTGPATRAELVDALVRCGYPIEYASKRCQANLWQEG